MVISLVSGICTHAYLTQRDCLIMEEGETCMVAHVYNASAQEGESGVLHIRGQSCIQKESIF